MALQVLCGSVAISTPLFSITTPESTGCFCFPNFEITNPFATGHGNFPLLDVKLLDKAIASGVDANALLEPELLAFRNSSAIIRSISFCIFLRLERFFFKSFFSSFSFSAKVAKLTDC